MKAIYGLEVTGRAEKPTLTGRPIVSQNAVCVKPYRRQTARHKVSQGTIITQLTTIGSHMLTLTFSRARKVSTDISAGHSGDGGTLVVGHHVTVENARAGDSASRDDAVFCERVCS